MLYCWLLTNTANGYCQILEQLIVEVVFLGATQMQVEEHAFQFFFFF